MESLQRDFFTQSCALEKPTKTQDADTNEEIITFAIQHDGIPCRVGLSRGGERRLSDGTYLDATHRIVLTDQFNDLTEEWIAVVDEQEYQILLVTPDAEKIMTRLECRVLR